jgi:hypothetical protein
MYGVTDHVTSCESAPVASSVSASFLEFIPVRTDEVPPLTVRDFARLPAGYWLTSLVRPIRRRGGAPRSICERSRGCTRDPNAWRRTIGPPVVALLTPGRVGVRDASAIRMPWAARPPWWFGYWAAERMPMMSPVCTALPAMPHSPLATSSMVIHVTGRIASPSTLTMASVSFSMIAASRLRRRRLR